MAAWQPSAGATLLIPSGAGKHLFPLPITELIGDGPVRTELLGEVNRILGQ